MYAYTNGIHFKLEKKQLDLLLEFESAISAT